MTMRNYVHILMAAVLAVAVSSCSRMEDDFAGMDEVRLKGALASRLHASAATRGEGSLTSAHPGPLYLGLVRIDETQTGYPADFRGEPALAATMKGAADIKDISFNEIYQTFMNDAMGVKYASWYPWYEKASEEAAGDYKYDEAEAKVTFPIDGSTDVMYGSIATGNKRNGFNTIVFEHALVRYRISAYAMVAMDENGEYLRDPDELWGGIEDITVKGMSRECVLHLPSVADGTGSGDYVMEYPSSAESLADFSMRTIEGIGEDGVLLESLPVGIDNAAAVAEFIAAPPVDNLLKLEIRMKEGDVLAQSISIARDFIPGCHYDVILRFSDHGLVNADVKVGDWSEGDEMNVTTGGDIFYDLSSNGTANCYMVSSANYSYCFNATVKGNGPDGVLDGMDFNLPDAAYVDVLWMSTTLDGVFELVSDRLSEGRVLFKVKGDEEDYSNKQIPAGKEGNVLLAVYSDEAKTDLLWTWHIWICDRPQIQSYKNGFVVLDRDLGAVESGSEQYASANPYAAYPGLGLDGLYYQWGRPTPFPAGLSIMKPGTAGAATADEVFPVSWEEGTSAVNAAISNPDRCYLDGITADDNLNRRLWGWNSVADEYRKTVYDPCPVGYRVPSRRLWVELDFSDFVREGHNITFSVLEGQKQYYPISGYYYDGSVNYYWNGTDGTAAGNVSPATGRGPGAFMWSATYDTDSQHPYLMVYQYSSADQDFSMDIRPAIDPGPALPVRCVSTRSTAHVENLSAYQTANTYVISEGGYYKFDASVRGNGIGHLVAPGSASTIDVSEGLATDIRTELVKVDYLWWQGDFADGNRHEAPPVVLDYAGVPDADGFVTFHVDTFREGNLILAGYDARGTVLWTWHIWLTDTPQLMRSNDYVLMDRFIGATYAPSAASADALSMTSGELQATYGLYYQWGRKDPFPGAASDGGTTSPWWKYADGSWVESTSFDEIVPASGRSVGQSVREPMAFHTSSYRYPDNIGSPIDANQFFSDRNSGNTWVGDFKKQEATEALWGYSSATGYGKTSTKTMYDPCPPGYSVTYYLVWTNTMKNGDGAYNYYTYLDSGYKYFESGHDEISAGAGMFMDPDRYGGLFDASWYPFAGYVHAYDGTFKGIGSQGRFHSSTPAGKGSRSFYYNDTFTAQAVTGNYAGLSTTFAYPVRCQKD